jgi:hypothetical protein
MSKQWALGDNCKFTDKLGDEHTGTIQEFRRLNGPNEGNAMVKSNLTGKTISVALLELKELPDASENV